MLKFGLVGIRPPVAMPGVFMSEEGSCDGSLNRRRMGVQEHAQARRRLANDLKLSG
jgi:hypothetical protein